MTPLTLSGGEENLKPLCDAVGSQIASVGYLVPSGAQWPDGREDGLRHEVDHGVELALTNGLTLSLRWEMQGENEFLAVETSSLRGSLIDVIDVSDVPEWSSIVGQTIRGLGIARHAANTDCPSSVWAIRFDVGNGSSFVIALGEIREDVPAYLPDAVLVLFEKEDAESYRTTASPTSAWGVDVAVA